MLRVVSRRNALISGVLLLSGLVMAGCTQPRDSELILVGGATGRQGGAVVDELLARGYRVRGLTRNPASGDAQALAARGVEIVQGDYGDPASLAAAFDGVRRAFFYSGLSRNEVQEGYNVIAAAQAAGVVQLVYSSGAAAEPGRGLAGAAKMQVEQAIVASGVPYTILRPVAFMENYAGQAARILRNGVVDSRAPDRRVYFISVRDIGLLVGEAFDNPDEWRNVAMNIASDTMTLAELTALFGRVLGRPVAYRRMPLADYLAAMPKPLRPLFRWYDEVGYSADVAALRARYPRLQTLEGYLRASGWGQTNNQQ